MRQAPTSGPRMRGEKISVRSGLPPVGQHVAEAGADRGEDEGRWHDPDHGGGGVGQQSHAAQGGAARLTSQKGKAGTRRMREQIAEAVALAGRDGRD